MAKKKDCVEKAPGGGRGGGGGRKGRPRRVTVGTERELERERQKFEGSLTVKRVNRLAEKRRQTRTGLCQRDVYKSVEEQCVWQVYAS